MSEVDECVNGMCLSDQSFLDGNFDFLEWSDDLQFEKDQNCFKERVSRECDDRIRPPTQWPCDDGQGLQHRLGFQA